MLPYTVKYATNVDREHWDAYVRDHPGGSLYHQFGWRDIINQTYGHSTYYLMASGWIENAPFAGYPQNPRNVAWKIQGVLPLVHLSNVVFGNYLISMPYLDGGGILANCKVVEEQLLAETVKLGRKIGASRIELRQEQPLLCQNVIDGIYIESLEQNFKITTKSHKVQMLLSLPDSSQKLMVSFKSKLRNQIKKPLKEGLISKVGSTELLDDFYKVFSINMRDLGSPVHSIKLIYHVLTCFPEQSKLIVVYWDNTPVAASMIIGLKKVLYNPWASSLRKYATLSPNMLLYLRMLEYACDHGYQIFDFGRSSPSEGTYKFKEQWGAMPAPRYWYYLPLKDKPLWLNNSEKRSFEKAVHYWKMLPLPVSTIIGPMIRKYIGL